MKKLLTGILALLTCFGAGMAVACGDDNGNKTPSGLAAAKDVLYSTYVNKDVEGRYDYEVLNSTAYDGVLYTVTWSVDVGSEHVVLEAGSQNKTLVNVNENSTEAVPYVLTATITDSEGNSVTVSFNRTLLAAPSLVPEAITAAPVEGKNYKLYVYQSTKNADCYFSGMMSGFYFQTVEDYEGAVDIQVEYKADSTTEFYLYFNHNTDGKQYIGVQEGWNATKSYWTFNVVYSANPPSSFVWSDEYNTIITTVPCRSAADNKNPDATEQPDTKTLYLGNYSTYMTISASTVDKAATSNVGGLVEMVDKNDVTPEKKVAEAKDALSLDATVTGAKEIELPANSSRHSDVAIAWAVAEHANATISNGKLVLTNPEADTTVTVTATLTCGEVSDTKEFTITLKHATEGAITTIAGALAGAEGATATFSGTVSKIYQEWSDQYSNISFYVTDGTDTILVFRAGTKVEVGYEVSVEGTVTAYNGVNQIAQGATVTVISTGNGGSDTPVDPPAGETTLVAVVPEVDKPYIFGSPTKK